ncbi:MAG: 50S ribosomal protein L25 [Candidatus Cloacimonetes bacterium]|jgi:large subunit ribosomal protein L25|nr:50S ribosomal protein L25 [Candidatus Cloacimonadota bacterium]
MNININAEKRNLGKKSNLTKIRKEGLIPGIIYGNGQEGIKISINARDYTREYKKSIGGIAFFDITVDGSTYKTFIKEKQIHPLTREITHIDFMELHKGKPITIDVPINFDGEAPGTKEGGVFEIILRKIQITCLPKDIPDEIRIDISALNIGDSIHFGDIKLSGDVETNISDETTIAAVSLPTILVEPEEEEELEGEEGAEGTEGAEGEEGEEGEEGDKSAKEEDSKKDSE